MPSVIHVYLYKTLVIRFSGSVSLFTAIYVYFIYIYFPFFDCKGSLLCFCTCCKVYTYPLYSNVNIMSVQVYIVNKKKYIILIIHEHLKNKFKKKTFWETLKVY